MKALVVHGAKDVRVEERPDPVAGYGQVLVAVEFGGICGSDVAYWQHGASGTAELRHPLVLGHEVAGKVAAVGKGVDGITVGTPVTVHPATYEGELPARLTGRDNLNSRVRYLGSAAFEPHTDGAFASLVAVRAEQLRTIPKSVPTRIAAMAEPLAVAMHAVHRAGNVLGRRVLVSGSGPIGSLVVAAARRAGAAEIIAADLSAEPLAVAAKLGASTLCELNAGDRLPTDVDVVFEASGSQGALGPALEATARGGTLVQVGNLPGSAVSAEIGKLVTKEISWLGSYRFVDEITDAVAALGAGLDLSPLVIDEFELADAVAALERAAAGGGKVLLRLGDAS